ncbi:MULTISPECIES: transporter substrate-binding domain-containing protein [unclassified Halomonas]|uniref:transporter substrate-binding domain-containing protein n=1 Tax=unclassified Halomonas TaxID=2609666 RepID=UPI00209E966B|nr:MULTISPECIES: transporter substrate-binding domain-containing protein [unclassified Halomonas]MCP1313188.1 transporter substrate-binding domain-containing protein [Halomonas sp. 707D7]MCP1326019.1 transporter substrate-binding domain-containing protein [Halomonas sp. 707D4]
MKRILTLSVLGLAVAAASSAQARDYDNVRIGVDIPYEPMEYRSADGELTGFDIDLGNALCEEIGVSCEWVEQEWDGIIPGLMSRNYDAIMSSMTINEERRRQVLFSDPYITMPSAWFAPQSLDIDEANEETLDGMTIGVQRGTLQDNYVTDNFGSVADISRYATADDMVLDMDAQRLDIVFLDFPIGHYTLIEGNDGEYKEVGERISEPKEYFGDGFGIAFRQRDEALAERFNEALATLQENGTYDEIYERYFGAE